MSLRANSPAVFEDGFQFFRCDYFKLSEGARFWFAVCAPAAEVGHVAEASALHVLVGDFDDEFGAERLPFEVFAVAPTALAAGHAVVAGGCSFFRAFPVFPGMIAESVFAPGREEGEKLAAHRSREAGAHSDMLEHFFAVV